MGCMSVARIGRSRFNAVKGLTVLIQAGLSKIGYYCVPRAYYRQGEQSFKIVRALTGSPLHRFTVVLPRW